jgi:hypothetical protein
VNAPTGPGVGAGVTGARCRLPLLVTEIALTTTNESSAFDAIRRKEAALLAAVERLDLKELGRLPLLSVNGKTSISLDFPVGQTCSPTAVCGRVCYAIRRNAPVAWEKSLVKRLRNWRYFLRADPVVVAARLTEEFRSQQRKWAKRAVRLDFLRINGTGDLFPKLIPVLNLFAAQNPQVRVWVVTRRFDLAAEIVTLPNVYLQLSLDSSTPPALVAAAQRLIDTHARAYASFLRTKADDDTLGASIVFNEKKTRGLPYHGRTDCPVDAARMPLGNEPGIGGTACSRCRKCFSERVFGRVSTTDTNKERT